MDQAFLEALTDKPISPAIDLAPFRCEPTIDAFLREAACTLHEKRVTWVRCWMLGEELVGYYTASMNTVEILPAQRGDYGLDELTLRKGGEHVKKFSCLLIGMLGTAENYVGRGLGKHMVKHAIGQAYVLSGQIGCRFVAVDSDPTELAMGLYAKCGFRKLLHKGARATVQMVYDLGARSSTTST